MLTSPKNRNPNSQPLLHPRCEIPPGRTDSRRICYPPDHKTIIYMRLNVFFFLKLASYNVTVNQAGQFRVESCPESLTSMIGIDETSWPFSSRITAQIGRSSSRLCLEHTEYTRMKACPLLIESRCIAGNWWDPVVSVICSVQIFLLQLITCWAESMENLLLEVHDFSWYLCCLEYKEKWSWLELRKKLFRQLDWFRTVPKLFPRFQPPLESSELYGSFFLDSSSLRVVQSLGIPLLYRV